MFNVILKYLRIFKKIFVGRDDIGPLTEEFAKNEGLSIQPRRKQISSYFLENGRVITPLLLFQLYLGLVCKKHRLVLYTPIKCSNNFVQSAVNAGREGNENPNCRDVGETSKLLANSSYAYQIMDRSRHTLTMYVSDEEIHAAINNTMFKRLVQINDQMFEVEFVKSENEHEEPIIVGFFILQCAKLRLLELYYKFFDSSCDVTKLEE